MSPEERQMLELLMSYGLSMEQAMQVISSGAMNGAMLPGDSYAMSPQNPADVAPQQLAAGSLDPMGMSDMMASQGGSSVGAIDPMNGGAEVGAWPSASLSALPPGNTRATDQFAQSMNRSSAGLQDVGDMPAWYHNVHPMPERDRFSGGGPGMSRGVANSANYPGAPWPSDGTLPNGYGRPSAAVGNQTPRGVDGNDILQYLVGAAVDQERNQRPTVRPSPPQGVGRTQAKQPINPAGNTRGWAKPAQVARKATRNTDRVHFEDGSSLPSDRVTFGPKGWVQNPPPSTGNAAKLVNTARSTIKPKPAPVSLPRQAPPVQSAYKPATSVTSSVSRKSVGRR